MTSDALAIDLRSTEAHSFNHSDRNATPKAYEIVLDGVVIGRVFNRTEESYRSQGTQSVFRYGFQGYRRFWETEAIGWSVGKCYSARAISEASTRKDAVAQFLDTFRRVMEREGLAR